jgi:hypothetical protein
MNAPSILTSAATRSATVSSLLLLAAVAIGACQEAGVTAGPGGGLSGADASPADAIAPDSGETPSDAELPAEDVPPPAPGEPTLVRIATPVADADVEGSISVELLPVGRGERLVDFVNLTINGEVVATDTKLPTRFVVDTRQFVLPRLVISAEAQDGFDRGSHTVQVRTKNPPIRFTEVTPRDVAVTNGQVISVTVQVDAPNDVTLEADFSALDSGFTAGSAFSLPLGGGQYAITYVISERNTRRDGTYIIPLKATLGVWEVTYEAFALRLQNKPVIGITVTNGIFVATSPPVATAGWAPAAPPLTASNTSVVTGGTTTVRANIGALTATEDIVGLLVSVPDQDGYFQIPVDPTAYPSDGEVGATVRIRQYDDDEDPPRSIPLRLALRDARGRVSSWQPFQLSVLKVGGGDIQFSLAWDTKADLDLHVIDPFNCEIYYGNRTCTRSGGELDLDSNIGCSNGPANENVFWPANGAPPGIYEARINTFQDACCASTGCRAGHGYTLTVNYCGRTEVYSGVLPFLSRGSADNDDAVRIARIDNRGCDKVATGRIRFQDKVFDEEGFGAFRWKPVEGALVELREIGTNMVLGTGVTDARGGYFIRYSTQAPGYIVAVRTRTSEDEGLRNIQLYDHPKFKRIYEVTSPPVLLLDPDAETTVQDLDISVERNAGAFNIFDILRQSWDQVRLTTGRTLPELRAFWATGTDTTDTNYCSRDLYELGVCTELGAVSVQGKDEDRDEYDDMIIAREFSKFALNELARDSHPGGVSDGRRDDARRSWTEGVTSFLAADITGSRHFVDSRPRGVYVVDDLEGMRSPFAFREVDANLSRYLVMALLWDLADSDNEDWDTLDRARSAVYDVLFTYLASADWTDRGPRGVDLTDFLDGWFCRGWGNREGLELLFDYHQLGYDFGGPTGCWP